MMRADRSEMQPQLPSQARVRRRCAASLISAVIAIGVLSAPASAAVIDRERYEGSDSFTFDCGTFTVDGEATFSGMTMIRVGTGPDAGAFFVHDTYDVRVVQTNATTGRSIVITGSGVFQETRATRVEGTIFMFSSINSGQPFTVTDEAGEVLLRDRGTVRETILFDTLGDDVPGGEFIESVELSLAGPHPGFFVDTCDLLA
jgi:hypothetical protein